MVLELAGVYKNNHSLVILKNINIYVKEREFVSLIGRSGSGKSTLLRLIAGLEQPSAGKITLDGKLIKSPGADRGLIFQNYTLYPWLNVAENIEFGLKLQKIAKKTRKAIVADYLEMVDLTKFAQFYPKQLSGGMKQRVAIARALASQPKILLMDEPFGALDVQTRENMQQFLLQIWQNTGCSILMVTHDVEEAIFLSQRIYLLTQQPGTIQTEFKIDLSRDNSQYDEKIKRNPTFQNYKYQIEDLLKTQS